MNLYFLINIVLLNVACEAFFFWKEKPIFFCFKVCPLYCTRDSKRRLDEDSSTTQFEDEYPVFEPEFWVEDFPYPPTQYYGHWVYKKKPRPTTTPKPTTTTPEPTTTTPEPTYICIVCEKKCGYKG